MCLLAGCNSDVETPLTGNLVKIEKQDSKAQKIISVKDAATGKVVIQPAAYTSITADENLIICTGKTGIKLFSLNGYPNGATTLATFQRDAKGYYTGTADGDERTHYYFPEKQNWIRSSATFETPDFLILQSYPNWIVVKFNGDKVWEFPLETATLIENKAGSDYQVALTPLPVKKSKKAPKPSTTLYSITGDSIATYNADQWEKKIKGLTQEDLGVSKLLRNRSVQAITPVKNIP
jgi:hypothetical protein